MMAKLPIDDPSYFWSRAEEARTMAGQMTDPENRRMMFGVAERYEVKRAEARSKGEKM